MALDCCLCLILHARYLKEEIEDVDELNEDQLPLKDIEWATMWSDGTDFRVLLFLVDRVACVLVLVHRVCPRLTKKCY